MYQEINNVLGVSFTCASTIAEGDVVEISADNTVAAVTSIGSLKTVGVVCAHRDSDTTCTVATRFLRRSDERIAGETVAVGPFVFGPDNKVYAYDGGTKAEVTCANAGTYSITNGNNDTLGVKINGESSAQTFDITAGAAITAAAIVTIINATADGFSASVTSAGKIKLSSDQIGDTLEITAESNSANTVLGFTAAVTSGTFPSHGPNAFAGLVIKSGDADEAVETLEFV